MRLVAFSDSHGKAPKVAIPEGDVLVHAGDLSMDGSQRQVVDELDWIAELPHPVKIVIPGNHDIWVERRPHTFEIECMLRSISCLIDEAIDVNGVKFWGSPWTPRFGKGWAYNADRGEGISEFWRRIPSDTDILVTHGPASGFGGVNYYGEDCGCTDLNREIIERVRPKLHVFGHIHEGYGKYEHPVLGTIFANVSLVDLRYNPVNAPQVFDL